MRELAVLMTAIMIAGRTGSAITAEIGSMAMREEIDALRVMALDPLEVLIMPRMVALVIALPVLTVVADMAQLGGGMIVSWLYAGMTPVVFITRLHNAITTNTFIVGLIKAPFMAATIGVIAGVEGMDVRGIGRVAGAQRDGGCGQVDLHGHRHGRAVRNVLIRGGLLSDAQPPNPDRQVIISVRGLKVGFGARLVMDGLEQPRDQH